MEEKEQIPELKKQIISQITQHFQKEKEKKQYNK